MSQGDDLWVARVAYPTAINRFAEAADRITEWSKTLPDEHRANLALVCRNLSTNFCFCGCHVTRIND